MDQPSTASRTVVDLLREGVLDTELAALVWCLLDGRVPLVIASPGNSARARRVLATIVGLAQQSVETVELNSVGRARLRELFATGAGPAGIALPMTGSRLEDIIERLRLSGGLTDDRIAWLGVVGILSREDELNRIVVAHYLQPPARDAGGHVQRLPPAVLATWDEGAQRFEHFEWGVTTELAARVAQGPAAFEAEVARRAQALAGLAAAAPRDTRVIGLALDAIRGGHKSGHSHES